MAQETGVAAQEPIRRSPATTKRAKCLGLPCLPHWALLPVFGLTRCLMDIGILTAAVAPAAQNSGKDGSIVVAAAATLAVISHAFALAAGSYTLHTEHRKKKIVQKPTAMHYAFWEAYLERREKRIPEGFIEFGAHPLRLKDLFGKSALPWHKRIGHGIMEDPEKATFWMVLLTSGLYVLGGVDVEHIQSEIWDPLKNPMKVVFGVSLGMASLTMLLKKPPSPDKKPRVRPHVQAAGLFSVPMVALLAEGIANWQPALVFAGLSGLAGNVALALSEDKEAAAKGGIVLAFSKSHKNNDNPRRGPNGTGGGGPTGGGSAAAHPPKSADNDGDPIPKAA
ncbi:MAG: hypothetical protein JKP92_01755 [Alphaproteobacteria bacterium]|jgi:hypothetical protein|nr:hypothetical protein [Alphaproteobacteria bacterium]